MSEPGPVSSVASAGNAVETDLLISYPKLFRISLEFTRNILDSMCFKCRPYCTPRKLKLTKEGNKKLCGKVRSENFLRPQSALGIGPKRDGTGHIKSKDVFWSFFFIYLSCLLKKNPPHQVVWDATRSSLTTTFLG